MKAALYFNLNDNDDAQAHLRCTKATEITLALWTIKNKLWHALDTSEDGKTINGDELQNEVIDTLAHYGIEFDNLLS